MAGAPLQRTDQDPQTTHLVAAAVAAEQVMDLVDQPGKKWYSDPMVASLAAASCFRPVPA